MTLKLANEIMNFLNNRFEGVQKISDEEKIEYCAYTLDGVEQIINTFKKREELENE